MSQLLEVDTVYKVFAVTDENRFVIADALSKETAIEKARAIRSWSRVCLEIYEPNGTMVGKLGY